MIQFNNNVIKCDVPIYSAMRCTQLKYFIHLFIQFFNMYIIYKVQLISVNDVERSRQVAALVHAGQCNVM